jgi:hypothetical protein
MILWLKGVIYRKANRRSSPVQKPRHGTKSLILLGMWAVNPTRGSPRIRDELAKLGAGGEKPYADLVISLRSST